MMPHYKNAYELGLDGLDLELCLDTDSNQVDYDGSRRSDKPSQPNAPPASPSEGEPEPPPTPS